MSTVAALMSARPWIRSLIISFIGMQMALVNSIRCKCAGSSRQFVLVSPNKNFNDIIVEWGHLPEANGLVVDCAKSEEGPWTVVADTSLTLSAVLDTFNVKCIRLRCDGVHADGGLTQPKPVPPSAFETLMASAKERGLPDKRSQSSGVKGGLNKKDALFNQIIDLLKENGALFLKQCAKSDGEFIVQTICNAIWYVSPHFKTVEIAAKHKPIVVPIPPAFLPFADADDRKKKKIKLNPLDGVVLQNHAQALFKICSKPVMRSQAGWVKVHDDLIALAECFNAYAEHLKEQRTVLTTNRMFPHPVREVESGISVVHLCKYPYEVKSKYLLLDSALKNASEMQPVMFDDTVHLSKPFENAMQRHRFFEDMQLSIPVDRFSYSPGGSHFTVYCFVRVSNENRSDSEKSTQVARITAEIKPRFPVFHTRCMIKEFKERLANIVGVSGGVADMIYKELTLDASVAAHPETQQRLRLIFLGQEGLLVDMRHLNAGRPSGTYDPFFEKLEEVVNIVTAADERRHNEAHMSEWISLPDLINQATDRCPPGTPIPSKSLVRLQFTPRNPYANTALSFTSRFNVQYKIQRRQLRINHIDDHYCMALYKYVRELAVLLSDDCSLICCDDKAKIPVGEPGVLLSTGVRGKKSLAPSATTLVAADHDVHHKGSLTPSVYLHIAVPDSADKSFYRGQVTTILNDSVFERSNPFRHSSAIAKQLQGKQCSILLKYSDGGTDQRNTLEAVKCASICLFYELDLDMLVAARCAPGHSYMNPAERVMSVLNLGLQNCATERDKGTDDIELKLKRCTSMDDIRKAGNDESFKTAWGASIAATKDMIQSRFKRLQIKGAPFKCEEPVKDDNIDHLKRHLRQRFPDLDLTKPLTKVNTSKARSYNNWLEVHSRQRQYCFQIKKCTDPTCCFLPLLPEDKLQWLPDPMLSEDGQHYLPFLEVYGKETTENDRPSLAKPKGKATPAAVPLPPTIIEDEELVGEASVYTAQNSRALATCTECQKPRVIYSKTGFTSRHTTQVALLLSEFDFSCGAPLTPPDHPLHGKIFSKLNITCASPIETSYYSASGLGRKDLCCQCGKTNVMSDFDLKKRYKVVLPLCETWGGRVAER